MSDSEENPAGADGLRAGRVDSGVFAAGPGVPPVEMDSFPFTQEERGIIGLIEGLSPAFLSIQVIETRLQSEVSSRVLSGHAQGLWRALLMAIQQLSRSLEIITMTLPKNRGTNSKGDVGH